MGDNWCKRICGGGVTSGGDVEAARDRVKSAWAKFRVSLRDRRRSEDLNNLSGIQSVADVVRHGRLR